MASSRWLIPIASMDEQIPAKKERIYAIMGTLDMHHYHDLLLFMIHHPYRRFVYQLTYATYLNLIELWWKVLRSLVLRGQRFETWNEVAAHASESV